MGNIISTCLNRDIDCDSECFDVCKLSIDVGQTEGSHHHVKIGELIEYDD